MTDLTDRMRTCAAYLSVLDPSDWSDEVKDVMRDAAKLLVEAAHEIDVLTGPVVPGHSVPGMGEPMEVIPPVVQSAPPVVEDKLVGTWVAPGGQLPLEWVRHRSKSACPKCDSRTQKKIYRTIDRTVMLVCPVCAHEWQYQR